MFGITDAPTHFFDGPVWAVDLTEVSNNPKNTKKATNREGTIFFNLVSELK
ncbi:MAG: hypothetical protein U0930_16100 [Pirellulales bacterium]